ncbi:hypothetical protein [Acetobacter syzygii]|uniref:hypothetical protein n=1 Tax=Acetobacter syzygii TaxID=146476 RepID=UPI0039ECE98D
MSWVFRRQIGSVPLAQTPKAIPTPSQAIRQTADILAQGGQMQFLAEPRTKDREIGSASLSKDKPSSFLSLLPSSKVRLEIRDDARITVANISKIISISISPFRL